MNQMFQRTQSRTKVIKSDGKPKVLWENGKKTVRNKSNRCSEGWRKRTAAFRIKKKAKGAEEKTTLQRKKKMGVTSKSPKANL